MLYRGLLREFPMSFFLVLTLLVLLSSAPAANASVYCPLAMQVSTPVTVPPVILQNGTVGTSTIYTNSTSAKSSVQASAAWLNGWDKRVGITIDHDDVDADLANFPILIYLSNSSSGQNSEDVSFVFDELQNDTSRKKIAVTKSDGLTQCYVEIERWDATSEHAWLWIKVPNISSKGNTDLYLYYDISQPDNTAYVGDKGSTAAQNVWDSDFRGVWHLGETSGGTGAIQDSTSNNNDGTDNGSPTFNASGLIDSAISFDGLDDYINMSNSASLQFTSSLTIEGWINLESFGSGSDVDIILRKGEGNPNDYQLAIHDQKLALMIEENDDAGLESTANLTATTWYYLAGTWNGSIRRVYLNGSEDGSGSKTGNIIPDTRDIYIGGRSGTDLSTGIIDEVRASNTTRSAAWIKASFESGRDDLLDFGSEEGNIIDHVDNNTSDLGSPTDLGTHSNFTAQQYGPDSIHDMLTEENTGVGAIAKVGTDTSGTGTALTLSFSHTLVAGSNRLVVVCIGIENGDTIDVDSVTYGGVATTKAVEGITGTSGYRFLTEIWYILENDLPGDGSKTVQINCSGTVTGLEVNGFCAEYTGVNQGMPEATDNTDEPSPPDSTIENTISPSNDSWVISIAGCGNSGSFTHAQGQVEVLDFADSSSTFAVAELRGASGETSLSSTYSATANRLERVAATWESLDVSYELDLEVQWINANYTLANEALCIRTGPFSGSEDLMVHAWNISASDWNWIMNLTANSWNNVSVSSYLNSSNFTIRFKGSDETNDGTEDNWNIDATQLHVWTFFETTYDYVLRVNNSVADSWQIRLKKYSNSSINRMQSCTIYFRNSTNDNSTQLVIENGAFVTETGAWINLGSLETIFIAMTAEANSTGTSYIYTYLEVRTPGTTTYGQCIIAFEIL